MHHWCFVQVCLEMAKPEVPDDTSVGFSLEFVWKATSFDRMGASLKLFKDYSASISGYLFHLLLGHEVRHQSKVSARSLAVLYESCNVFKCLLQPR
jgi:hypothetical protein